MTPRFEIHRVGLLCLLALAAATTNTQVDPEPRQFLHIGAFEELQGARVPKP